MKEKSKKTNYLILFLLLCICVLSYLLYRSHTAAPPAHETAPATEQPPTILPAPEPTMPPLSQDLPSLEELLGPDYAALLTQEITMQMENRKEKWPWVDYFPLTQGTSLPIDAQTQYYLDEDGVLVIFFPAGTVASPEHGNQRFRIPQGLNATPEQTGDLWNLVLVNPWNPIDPSFTVELTQLRNGQSVDSRAYPDLQAMMDDARAAGLSPLICSSYRTDAQQQSLYRNKVNNLLSQGYDQSAAETEAARWVAVPGTSEHQLGLAVDIVASSYQVLDETQEQAPEQQWLMANAHRYGFILRYPSDKSVITGIGYEPWHYRYVGKEAAQEIYQKDLTLEEYLLLQTNR